MRVGAASVGEGLTIVIVLLLTEAQGGEGDIGVGCGADIVDAAACGGGETEVLHDGGQCIRPVTPIGVVDGGVEVVVVATPLGFSEAGIAAEYYPVCERADQRVLGGAGREVRDVMKHTIGDHLLTFRNSFVLFDGIGHHFNIVNVYVMWVREAAIGVQGDGLLDVSEQRRVPYPYAGDGVASDQRDCVAGDDPVAALQGQFGGARVR